MTPEAKQLGGLVPTLDVVPAPNVPLLLTAEQAAALAGVSRSHWWSLHSAALVPMPIKLGRATRWRRDELEQWVAAGCPPRHEWNQREGG